MKHLKVLKEAKIKKGTKVLLRINADVPIDDKFKIVDDSRLRDTLPTLKYLLSKKAKVIILNKIGRPDGKRVEHLSNKILVDKLKKLLKSPIKFIPEIYSQFVNKEIDLLSVGEVLLLENTRFWHEEESNDKKFIKMLASYGDIFVNEAFSVCHRSESSVSGVAKFLPSYAGFSLKNEIKNLNNFINGSPKGKVAIIGGLKIDTKVSLIKNLSKNVESVLLGGAVANSLLQAKGNLLGKSLVDSQVLKIAKSVINNKLVLPVDLVVTSDSEIKGQVVLVNKVENDLFVYDIGPETIKLFNSYISKAKYIVWNGPMGYFEKSNFAKGTKEVAALIVKSKAKSVCGGGETLLALKLTKNLKKISFVSMAGGAMLEYLAGRQLPGLRYLYK